MRHTDFTQSEIFTNFADIMLKDKRLEKKAEFLYPDYNTEVRPELDLGWGVFSADKRTSLYGVTNETGDKLVGDAHKGGGPKTQLDHKPSDNLDKIETIVERHKIMEDIARSMPKPRMAAIITRLISLANTLDEDGFEGFAVELDEKIQALAEVPVGTPAGIGEVVPGLHAKPKGPPVAPNMSHLTPEEQAAFKDGPAFQHPAKPHVAPHKAPGQAQIEMGKPTVTNAPAPTIEMGNPVVTNVPRV